MHTRLSPYSRRILLIKAFAVLLIAFVACGYAQADVKSRIAHATSGFKDACLKCKVVYANRSELKKVSRDFATSYEFKNTTVYYKAPDKMKIEGKLGWFKAAVVINGNLKGIHIPVRGWQMDDIKDAPHKRQTDLDLGIISDSLWHNYVVLSTDEERCPDGSQYKITFVWSNSRDKKQVAWVDAERLCLLKLKRFESDGSLIATYLYSDHKQVNGIWVPTRVDVYNREGKLAGATECYDVKINCGLPDSVFKF